MNKTLLLLAVCVVAGCSDSSVSLQGDETAAFRLPPDIGPGRAYGAPGVIEGRVLWDDVMTDEIFDGHIDLMGKMDPSLMPKSVPTPDDLDGYRAFFAEHADDPSAYLVQQTLAFQILGKVEDDLDNPNAALASGYATELLIQNENPNADLIARSLERVEGVWSPAEIASAKTTAAAAARSWVKAPCRGCAVSEGPLGGERERAHRAEVLVAAEALVP